VKEERRSLTSKRDVSESCGIPDLVRIVIGTFPHLDLGSGYGGSVGEIETFTFVGPCDAIVCGESEELVCVSFETFVDLH